MLLISSSHEKQTAIKPRASRDSLSERGREFFNDEHDHSEGASADSEACCPAREPGHRDGRPGTWTLGALNALDIRS